MFFSPKQEAPKYPSYDSTTLINSAFPERDTSPVRKLVEDLVLQEPMAEEPDEASGSDVYLSSTEDTAEFEKIRLPLESVTVSCQTAQFSELEWDAAGCGLEVESFDGAEIEELVACAVEGVNSCDGFKGIGCSHTFFFFFMCAGKEVLPPPLPCALNRDILSSHSRSWRWAMIKEKIKGLLKSASFSNINLLWLIFFQTVCVETRKRKQRV